MMLHAAELDVYRHAVGDADALFIYYARYITMTKALQNTTCYIPRHAAPVGQSMQWKKNRIPASPP